jgi:cytidylate kinase
MSVAVVGPCASGKSTLVEALREAGWDARQIVQEHSYVRSMWRTIRPPDVLIYLDASFETCTARKQLNWSAGEYQEQVDRLADARQRCDFYLNSDAMPADEVARTVLAWLTGRHDSAEAL